MLGPIVYNSPNFLIFAVIIDKNKVPSKYKEFDPYHIAVFRGFRQIHNYLANVLPWGIDKSIALRV